MENKIYYNLVIFFDIAVKMITMMPEIESDSVIENQEDANEKGNFHIKILRIVFHYELLCLHIPI